MDEIDPEACRYCLRRLCSPYLTCVECRLPMHPALLQQQGQQQQQQRLVHRQTVRLCLRCFACGAESGKHSRRHDYRLETLRDWQKQAIFHPDTEAAAAHWSFEEETRLLDSIDVFGFGNWSDVASKVDGRTGDQCIEHYSQYYMRGAIGSKTFAPAAAAAGATDGTAVATDKPLEIPIVRLVEDLTGAPGAPLSPSLFQALPPADLTQEEAQLLGFMPLRGDFERDYDNEAESLLCQLQPSFEQDELDNALRVAQIDMYTGRLQERQRRKLIATRHGLLHQAMRCILARTGPASSSAPSVAALIGASPGPRRRLAASYNALDIDDRLKPFLRYLGPAEARQFLSGVEREERLKWEINQLLRLRTAGHKRLPVDFFPPDIAYGRGIGAASTGVVGRGRGRPPALSISGSTARLQQQQPHHRQLSHQQRHQLIRCHRWFLPAAVCSVWQQHQQQRRRDGPDTNGHKSQLRIQLREQQQHRRGARRQQQPNDLPDVGQTNGLSIKVTRRNGHCMNGFGSYRVSPVKLSALRKGFASGAGSSTAASSPPKRRQRHKTRFAHKKTHISSAAK